jgi:hypothetical protein
MIEVTIRCDHEEQPRAREGKPSNWCRSAEGESIQAAHRDTDTVMSSARTRARNAGWKKTKINPMGQRGYLCPNCYARAYEGA